jgi:hypothetical protein
MPLISPYAHACTCTRTYRAGDAELVEAQRRHRGGRRREGHPTYLLCVRACNELGGWSGKGHTPHTHGVGHEEGGNSGADRGTIGTIWGLNYTPTLPIHDLNEWVLEASGRPHASTSGGHPLPSSPRAPHGGSVSLVVGLPRATTINSPVPRSTQHAVDSPGLRHGGREGRAARAARQGGEQHGFCAWLEACVLLLFRGSGWWWEEG